MSIPNKSKSRTSARRLTADNGIVELQNHGTLKQNAPADKGARKNMVGQPQPPAKVQTKAPRREQQRAIETRQVILDAALSEFAQHGFDAASIRAIGARTGLQHPLITYHFRSKDDLWKAVAKNAFSQIRELWNGYSSDSGKKSLLEELREEYFAFLRFTLDHPDFHHFMLRENQPGNPRLPWLVEAALLPTMERLLPQIRSAQALGQLPDVAPALVHYLMIGMMTVLSSLKEEISLSSGLNVGSPEVMGSYMALVDALIFRRSPDGDGH